MDKQKAKNITDYIRTDEDRDLFVRTIGDLWSKAHTKESDDEWAQLPRQARQLLWIVAAWMNEEIRPSERTIDSVMKVLDACKPETKRDGSTAFDIILDDCKQELIKEKYTYFKHEAFGIRSRCYREAVQMCMEALQELSFEELEGAIQEEKEQTEEQNEPKKEKRPLFGEFTKRAGQDLLVNQYEKYLTALHEASHAVAHYLLGLPFHGVTIVSANDCGGALYSKNAYTYEPRKHAVALYAGEAGELAILNPIFPRVWYNGSDVYQATEIIKQKVIRELSNPRDALQYIFIDADALGLADKESPYIIYETIKRCVALRQEAIDLIAAHKDMVAALADELLKEQSMPSEEVIAFLDNWQAQHNPK